MRRANDRTEGRRGRLEGTVREREENEKGEEEKRREEGRKKGNRRKGEIGRKKDEQHNCK